MDKNDEIYKKYVQTNVLGLSFGFMGMALLIVGHFFNGVVYTIGFCEVVIAFSLWVVSTFLKYKMEDVEEN